MIVDPADIPSVVDKDPGEQLPAVEHLLGRERRARAKTQDCSVVLKYGMKRDFNTWLTTLGAGARR